MAAASDGGLHIGGGRVLGVGATGPTLDEARRRAYTAVSAISWEDMTYRRDIASESATA